MNRVLLFYQDCQPSGNLGEVRSRIYKKVVKKSKESGNGIKSKIKKRKRTCKIKDENCCYYYQKIVLNFSVTF